MKLAIVAPLAGQLLLALLFIGDLDWMGLNLSDHIFLIFPAYLLSALSFVVSSIHIYKYYCKEEIWHIPGSKRQAYLVRALNWLVFGVALLLFPHFDLTQGRAILRIALAFMVLSELGYNAQYLGDMFRDIPKAPSLASIKLKEYLQWTLKSLRLL